MVSWPCLLLGWSVHLSNAISIGQNCPTLAVSFETLVRWPLQLVFSASCGWFQSQLAEPSIFLRYKMPPSVNQTRQKHGEMLLVYLRHIPRWGLPKNSPKSTFQTATGHRGPVCPIPRHGIADKADFPDVFGWWKRAYSNRERVISAGTAGCRRSCIVGRFQSEPCFAQCDLQGLHLL